MNVQAQIDRIEGDIAVLLVGEQSVCVHWPVHMLPKQAAEGQILTITLTIDHNSTGREQQEVQDLMKRLLKR